MCRELSALRRMVTARDGRSAGTLFGHEPAHEGQRRFVVVDNAPMRRFLAIYIDFGLKPLQFSGLRRRRACPLAPDRLLPQLPQLLSLVPGRLPPGRLPSGRLGLPRLIITLRRNQSLV